MKTNEFYCVKCKGKVVLADKHITCATLKNKRPALRGQCNRCETNLCKFVKSSDEHKLKTKFRRSTKSKKRSSRSPKKRSSSPKKRSSSPKKRSKSPMRKRKSRSRK